MGCERRISRLHRLVEEELGDREAKYLKEHIDECPVCSERMREIAEMKALLEEQLDAELAVPELDRSFLDRSAEPISMRRRPSALGWIGISLAAAASLAFLTFAGLLYHLGYIGPKPVAGRLTHISVAGGEWTKDERAIRGMTKISTAPNERLLVRLENGTMVILNNNTVVEIQSTNQLHVLTGEIYADTAGRKGVLLRIKTRQATTLVTGTKLGVSAGESGMSVVVAEGKVTVVSEWGKQVVVRGNIFRIVQSMRPGPPKQIDVDEVFSWVKERERLAGVMIDLYEKRREGESSPLESNVLLQQILYGMDQSRQAVTSGDAIFDVVTFSYGYDLTDEERKKFLEHVVAGHIAQLDSRQNQDEDNFRRMVQDVVDSATLQNRILSSEQTMHFLFSMPDRLKLEVMDQSTGEFRTKLLVEGRASYRPTENLFQGENLYALNKHPAYFGKSYLDVAELANPRIVGTEDLNGTTTYMLEADEFKCMSKSGNSSCVIQLWVDPARGYLVLKTRRYTGVSTDWTIQSCNETIADSFQEVSPGVFYPSTFVENYYTGELISGEMVLRKTLERIYTLRDGKFNTNIPGAEFASPVPRDATARRIGAKWPAGIDADSAEQPEADTPEEYLGRIYEELERVRLYDDPASAGSRKLILHMDGKDLENTLRYRGGVIYGSATYRGRVVGAQIFKIDPSIAADVPFLPGDIIFTLNDEPWKVKTAFDWILGLEKCIPIVNSGRPVTAGISRHGDLCYVVIWFD